MLRLARLLAVPGLAVALAAAGIVLSVVGLPDDPPPADADLIVEFPEVPYEQNGYVALQEALERGEDFVSAVRAALELPFFQRPHFEVWEDIYYFTLSFYDLRTSFERLIEVAEGAGNHEAAFEAGLQAVELGRRIEAQPGFDVYLGIALQGFGREAIRRALPGLALPSETLVAAAASMARGESTRDRRIRHYRIA